MISAVISFKDNRVSIHSSETDVVGKEFSSGFYSAYSDSNGNMHIKKEFMQELHEPYNSNENTNIIRTIENFFNDDIKEKINTLGFIHKLGILLHGKAGTGDIK